ADRAIVDVFDEAVVQLEAAFGDADDIADGDLLGRAAKADTAIAAAQRLDQSAVHEDVHDLEQVQLGDAVGARDVTNPARAARVHRAIHERLDGIAGLLREPHRPSLRCPA